jgi:hypothetical protein
MDPVVAAQLVARLAAAFPYPRPPDETLRLYTDELTRLPEGRTAAEAVEAVVLGADRWPPLRRLLDEYALAARRRQDEYADTHGLPEPELMPITEEQVTWMREFLGRGLQTADPRPRVHTKEELARAAAEARAEAKHGEAQS